MCSVARGKAAPSPRLPSPQRKKGGRERGRSVCLNSKQDAVGRGLHGDLSNSGTHVSGHTWPPVTLPTPPALHPPLLLPGLRVTLQLQAEPLGLAQGRAHAVLC